MKTADKYDKQLVVEFQTGGADPIIVNSSIELAKAFSKLKGIPGLSTVTSWNSNDVIGPAAGSNWTAMRSAMDELSDESRVYLNGHGDWESQTISGLGPKDVAKLLFLTKMPSVKTLCVTACGLGRLKTKKGLIFNSVSSFATKLHAKLKEDYYIRCEVHAYVLDMGVYTQDTLDKFGMSDQKLILGRKYTSREEVVDGKAHHGAVFHRQQSKIILSWAGNKQVTTQVLYEKSGGI